MRTQKWSAKIGVKVARVLLAKFMATKGTGGVRSQVLPPIFGCRYTYKYIYMYIYVFVGIIVAKSDLYANRKCSELRSFTQAQVGEPTKREV